MARRCLIASASISGLGSATVLSGINTASDRSGENKSVSEASAAPRALLTSRYARASNIGRSGSPAIKLSRYAERLAVAVWAVAMRCGACARAFGSFSKLPTSFSISSLNRVAAPSPTMVNAPVTWCRCVAAYLAALESPGLAANASRCVRVSVSECSISAFTQDNGPISNAGLGLSAIYCEPDIN